MLQYFIKYIPKNALLEDLKIPLAIVATDYETGKPVVFTKGSIISAIRASISIPGVFIPVSYKGDLLVDGGVSDPLPIDVAKQLGAESIIAVNLQPSVEHKAEIENKNIMTASSSRISSLISRHVEIFKSRPTLRTTGMRLERWLEHRSAKKESMPNMFDIMSHSIQTMLSLNTTLSIQKYKPDVLIEPNLLNLSGFSLAYSKDGFAEGKRACEKAKKKLQRIAKENNS
jgi:NTE family protein